MIPCSAPLGSLRTLLLVGGALAVYLTRRFAPETSGSGIPTK